MIVFCWQPKNNPTNLFACGMDVFSKSVGEALKQDACQNIPLDSLAPPVSSTVIEPTHPLATTYVAHGFY